MKAARKGSIGIFAAAALGLAAVAGVGAIATTQSPVTTEAVQPARVNPTQQTQQQQAPGLQERMAIALREDRRTRFRTPRDYTKHKNRASGERAHRNWRKRRSSGRA